MSRRFPLPVLPALIVLGMGAEAYAQHVDVVIPNRIFYPGTDPCLPPLDGVGHPADHRRKFQFLVHLDGHHALPEDFEWSLVDAQGRLLTDADTIQDGLYTPSPVAGPRSRRIWAVAKWKKDPQVLGSSSLILRGLPDLGKAPRWRGPRLEVLVGCADTYLWGVTPNPVPVSDAVIQKPQFASITSIASAQRLQMRGRTYEHQWLVADKGRIFAVGMDGQAVLLGDARLGRDARHFTAIEQFDLLTPRPLPP